MTRTLKHLSFEDQINLFKARGMTISNEHRAKGKLENIGYYKLKEFAYPLSKVIELDGEKQRVYEGVNFDQIVTRYYQDKNLRIFLLHAIEKIEVSLKTKIAYILGERYGPFGYLSFSNWCNKEEYCKHYLNDREYKFKGLLRNKLKQTYSHDIKDKSNLNKDGYPTVWLVFEVLTFGDVLMLLSYMSKRNLEKLSNCYNCTPDELLSWLKCLKFVRNICAHNSNIIDLKLKTTPKIKDAWKADLYKFEGKSEMYTDRIAVVILIIYFFIKQINSSYQFADIRFSLNKIIDEKKENAEQIGFKEITSIDTIYKPKPKKRYKHHKQYKKPQAK